MTELNHRIAAGWARFHSLKAELTGKFYNVGCRIKLFQAAITTTVLYGCATWALTKKMCEALETTRRKMLRYVLRVFRRRDETWVEYLQRSAREVKKCDEHFGLTSWTYAYKSSKWKFAGQLARRTDHRWSALVCTWKPPAYKRAVGRPLTRWVDDIATYAGGDWDSLAMDEARWKEHEAGFCMN